MQNARSEAGARDDPAAKQDRAQPTARNSKVQGDDGFTARKFAWLLQVAADAALKHSAVRVAIVLADRWNRKTGDAWPSIEFIRDNTRLSRAGVHNAIRELIDRDHLERERSGGKQGGTSRYRPRLSGEQLSMNVDSSTPKQSTRVDSSTLKTVNGRGLELSTPVDPSPRGQPLKKRESDDSLSEHFREFYWHYPKKVKPKAAEKAFAKAVKEGAHPQDIIAGCLRYAAEVDGKDRHFIAHPSTWLNDGRWLDEPTPRGTQKQGEGRMSAAEWAQRRGEAIEQGQWYDQD